MTKREEGKGGYGLADGVVATRGDRETERDGEEEGREGDGGGEGGRGVRQGRLSVDGFGNVANMVALVACWAMAQT